MAKILGIRQATIAKSTKRMEENNLVAKSKDSQDNRVSRIYLTEKGRNIKENVEVAWNILEDKTIATFTLEERILLRQLLIKVVDNLTK